MLLEKLDKGVIIFKRILSESVVLFVLLQLFSCAAVNEKTDQPADVSAASAAKTSGFVSKTSPPKQAVIKPQVFFREGNAVKINSVAPTFTASTIKNTAIDTSDNEGKIYLLNFWSIRCGPCIKEMPYLQKLYEEYKSNGLYILSINTDQASKDEVTDFISKRECTITYDVLVDPDLILSSVFTKWFVPVTILIDSKGVVRYNNTGFTKRDYEKYRKIIESLIKEQS